MVLLTADPYRLRTWYPTKFYCQPDWLTWKSSEKYIKPLWSSALKKICRNWRADNASFLLTRHPEIVPNHTEDIIIVMVNFNNHFFLLSNITKKGISTTVDDIWRSNGLRKLYTMQQKRTTIKMLLNLFYMSSWCCLATQAILKVTPPTSCSWKRYWKVSLENQLTFNKHRNIKKAYGKTKWSSKL